MSKIHKMPKMPFFLIDSVARLFRDTTRDNIFEEVKGDFSEQYYEDLQRHGRKFANQRLWFGSVVFAGTYSARLFMRPLTKLISKIIS